METRTSIVTETADRELVITRVFDAPRSLVFKTWTDPEHLARWWGPRDFTTISSVIDVRPGGVWFRCMRASDGTEHRKRGVYREILEPERLVFTYASEDTAGNPGHQTMVTVTFADFGDKTKVTLRQAVFESVTARDAHEGGWTSCLARFADYLANAGDSKTLLSEGRSKILDPVDSRDGVRGVRADRRAGDRGRTW